MGVQELGARTRLQAALVGRDGGGQTVLRAADGGRCPDGAEAGIRAGRRQSRWGRAPGQGGAEGVAVGELVFGFG